MRTKISILSAVALAAGLASASAQVYSANIVGYVNTPIPANSGFTLINNPLDAVNNNIITSVIPNPVPGLALLFWTGAGYAEYDYLGGAPGEQWYDVNNDAFADATLTVPPGQGFFAFQPGAGISNLTFVGTALVNTQTVAMVAGLNLVGSKIPYGTNANTYGLNNALEVNDYILKWTPSGFSEFDYFGAGSWYDVNSDDLIQPQFIVGEGFFAVRAAGNSTWTNTLVIPTP